MQKKAFIDYSKPDAKFWEEYSALWQNSTGKPAFQSPRLLQYFVEKSATPVIIYKFYVGERLKGAALFHKKGEAYSFLSDMKTDHNSFVICKKSCEAEIKAFFEYFHEVVRQEGLRFVLNNQPMWAPYMDLFIKSGRSSQLFWLSSKSSVCPMLVEETPAILHEKLSKSRNNRYKLNRLQREYNATFEAFCGDEDMERWADDFCQCHIARWTGTNTPSKYIHAERREFLLNCLKAWHQEGILTRFALKANENRIAFIIGLRQENSLIYHKLTHDPAYNKHSPSLVLMIFLGEWMAKHNFNVLDFGDGGEPYKYNFANEEGQLNSIFIGPKRNLPFILRARVISMARSSPALIRFYRQKVKPLARMLMSPA